MPESWFETEVKAKGLVVVSFCNDHDDLCKDIDRTLKTFVDENRKRGNDKIKVVRVNVDADPDLVKECGVKDIPSLILFKDGQENGRSGYVTELEFGQFLLKALNATTKYCTIKRPDGPKK